MAADLWFPQRRRRHSERGLRLFCLPHAGGSAAAYARWKLEDVEVWPIELPGRAARFHERPYRSMTSLVAALLDAMRPHLDRPFALFGHSMGGVAGFELARQLCREHTPAELLVISGASPRRKRAPVHQLPDREFLEHVRRLGAATLDEAAHLELLEVMLPCLRADFELIETHVVAADAAVSHSVAIYGGDCDPLVPASHLAEWADHCRGALEVRVFPGGHFYLHESEAAVLGALAIALRVPVARSIRE